jgi:hypothetical protein
MTTDLTPAQTEVETDSYALVIHEDGQVLYQYEKPTPWEEPQWIEKRQYEHGEVPPLNLEQTQVKQRTNGESLQTVTLYATELDSDTTYSDTVTNGESRGGKELREDVSRDRNNGYIIQFSDGKEVPEEDSVYYTTQRQNMGAAIDYLVREHDLIDEINIPHFPPQARKNCSINSNPVHPNGDEMRNPYELTGGYYLHTSLNKPSKKERTRDLAEKVELSVDFLGKW